MTVQLGDTGRVAAGTYKKFTITLPAPNETLLTSPISSLPTTNPGSSGAQISYTLQQSDFPTISPTPVSTSYALTYLVGGKNTDAASQTINFQIYQNGASIASGSQAVSTNTFYTLNMYVYNVKVGDVIAVALWCSSANMNYDYYAPMITPTRTQLSKPNTDIKDLTFGASSSFTLTKGNPQQWLGSSYYFIHGVRLDNQSPYTIQPNSAGGLYVPYTSFNSIYGALQANYGDANLVTNAVTNATYRPRYSNQNIPSTITFREVLR